MQSTKALKRKTFYSKENSDTTVFMHLQAWECYNFTNAKLYTLYNLQKD